MIDVYNSCKKYIQQNTTNGIFNINNLQADLGLTNIEFSAIYQASDTGNDPKNTDEWLYEVKNALGMYMYQKQLDKLTKKRLKTATCILLSKY